ncbi:hypothetical protein [Pseudomonas sp. AM8]|uniref:hypothetical protein n=1 Tax=Pseudomonas sp. AM8 TaxID=2983368 RepID=UPI002E80C105|nr:hypothetical protein [Pseudomonas sp. AM8]
MKQNSPKYIRFGRKLLGRGMGTCIIMALITIITIVGFTFFGGAVRSQIASPELKVSSNQDSSQLSAAEGVMEHTSASNSGAKSLPALHVVLAWESLLNGENWERKNYRARLDACRESGWPTRALSSDEEARLGTGEVEILIDARRQFAQQTIWTLGADGDGVQSACLIRLEKHTDHGEIEDDTGMYEAIDSDSRIQERQNLQSIGWRLMGEEQIKGQPCTRWQNDRQSVCTWSGGMKWGFTESPGDAVGCTVDGAGTYLDAIPLEAQPLEGGSGCRMQVKSFSLGEGLLPSNEPGEEARDQER